MSSAARQAVQPINILEQSAARRQGFGPEGAMSVYRPGTRDWMADLIRSGSGLIGANPQSVESVIGGMDFVPGLGEMVGGGEAGEELGKGNYLSGGAQLAMSLVPGGGKLAKKVFKGGKEKLAEAVLAKESKPTPAGFRRVYDPQAFHSAVGEAKAGHKYGPAVEQKAVDDYRDTMMFMSDDDKSGFAIKPDRDLVSVFSSVPGRFDDIMEAANARGAAKLDAFDIPSKDPLPVKYGRHGFKEEWRAPWNPDYKPPDWTEPLGEPDVVGMGRPLPPQQPPGPRQAVAGTWGDKDRPDIMFEGVSPHEFTPGQWGRFGKAYGAHNIGPEDEMAWYTSLLPFTGKSGREYRVPGGLEDQTPFTYFDDLFMKSQGINPNDLTPAQHLAIHNRTVAGKQAPPGGFSDEQINNQLQMALLSPNNPLTPNELAVASTMAKHGDNGRDLADIASAVPGFNYADHPMYTGKDSPVPVKTRRDMSNAVVERLGLQSKERGGSGVSGNQDYTTVTGLAQMMKEKPEFFRLREGENWADFVDRLQTQVPGLQGKTGSFGAVWQDPAEAATSAMDRHMLNVFRNDVFANPKEQALWERGMLKQWNKANPKAKVKTVEELRKQGGTGYFNDKIFGYVNQPKEGVMRLKKSGEVNPETPAHLRPENADYVKEPKRFTSLGPAYRRGLDANEEYAKNTGQTGIFSGQWNYWDKIRNRFEPHEIMQPGLADLPRLSEEQLKASRQAHTDAGYMNYTKDAKGNLQPVKPVDFDPMAKLSPGRDLMRQLLEGLDPSKLAYFSLLFGLPIAGASQLGGDRGDQLPRRREEG